MEVFLIRTLQFILAISLLVFLHEGGHFFFSKLFGVRVEKFFIFFDVSIGKWAGKLFSFKPKNSDTEYGLGWLPLGGYCKISGMIDESFDTEQMKQPEQEWEFRSKPAWQRLLIMIGGVLVNFLLALFIYSMIMFTWGDSYVAVKDMTYGMYFNEEAKELGFQDGDVLLSHDGIEFKSFDADFYRDIASAHEVSVLRNGQTVSISLPGDLNLLNMLKNEPQFVRPLIPAQIDSVIPSTPAMTAGLRKGDVLKGINGREVNSYNEFVFEIGRLEDMMASAETHEDSLKVRSTSIVYERGGVRDTMSVTLTSDLKLGFAPLLVMMDDESKAQLIAENPLYGVPVCKCCHVSEGELVDALHRALPVKTLDALKWRTGATMGPCHGGRCTARIMQIMQRELGAEASDALKRQQGSSLVVGEQPEASESAALSTRAQRCAELAHKMRSDLDERGLREIGSGALGIAGTRPAGVYSALQALELFGVTGHLPGRKAIVWGTHDLVLRVAAALVDAGVSIECILETESEPVGTPALLDELTARGIPVHYQARITSVSGNNRLESASVAYDGTCTTIACDLLIASPSIVPE